MIRKFVYSTTRGTKVHLAHQYELLKIPSTKWSWLVQHRRGYAKQPRGDMIKDFGVELVPHYEKGKYDMAVLHLDQQCFEEGISHRGKGSLTREVKDIIGADIPKVLVMHGTPYFPESFVSNIKKNNYEALGYTEDQIGMSGELIDAYKEFAKDFDVLVFNSRTARRQWGCEPIGDGEKDEELTYIGRTRHNTNQYAIAIWHGFDRDEWWDLPKEPRVITMINPAGLDAYYDRTLLRGVREILQDKGIYHCHITVDTRFRDWDEYREFIGRSLVYFNPTKESPMPRARSEAMVSGACVVSTRGQDAEDFIESGVNGVIVPRNPQFIADLIEGLILDYKKAIELGQEGKKTAEKEFSGEKFRNNWGKIIKQLTNKEI